jgi:hypothetical protein
MPEFESEKVSAPKSSRPWTLEGIARLKARVPIRRNGWNTCAEILDDWRLLAPWSILFFFALSLMSPQMRDVLGLDIWTASWLTLLLTSIWVTPTFVCVIAEKEKIRPPKWCSRSLGDFYDAHGEIAAMSEFQALLTALLKYVPREVPAWSPYEIEWCRNAPIIVVWRLRYSRVTIGVFPTKTTRLEYEDKVPVVVFDTANRRVIDPSEIQ